MRVDSHQHFWKYDPERDTWIDSSMQVLQKNFLPEHLRELLQQNKMDACVAVQADQSEAETEFLLNLAFENDFIAGVVGWLDLKSETIEERLEVYKGNVLLKGLRHIVQAESKGFMLREDFRKGIRKLRDHDLSYDILIYQHQFPEAIDLVKSFPDQRFVLDHLGKPAISKGVDQEWVENLKRITEYPNLYCKLSGLVTETENYSWTLAEMEPFLDTVVEAFGTDRLMFGSDWPVCLLSSTYKEVKDLLEVYLSRFSDSEYGQIMGGNAVKWYKLSQPTA